jgi:hypothetical protein
MASESNIHRPMEGLFELHQVHDSGPVWFRLRRVRLSARRTVLIDDSITRYCHGNFYFLANPNKSYGAVRCL